MAQQAWTIVILLGITMFFMLKAQIAMKRADVDAKKQLLRIQQQRELVVLKLKQQHELAKIEATQRSGPLERTRAWITIDSDIEPSTQD